MKSHIKAKILHILNDRNVGGILKTTHGFISSRLKEQFEFLFLTESEAIASMPKLKPDLIIWHDPCSWRVLLQLFRLRLATKLLIHEHHYSESFETWKVRSHLRFRLVLRLAYGIADKVVAVSEGQAAWMRSHHLVRPSKLVTIQQCHCLDKYLALPSKPSGTSLVLGAYGRFSQQKGFDTLMQAMRLVPDLPIKLLVGGYGEQEELLRSLAGDDPRIHFVGSLSNVSSFLAESDVVVIPSNWEPWGNVCLEAKAAGKAVIVTCVDGLIEQVCDCGLLVPPNDPKALAESITKVHTLPRSQLQRWGENGRADVKDAWPDYITAWEALLCDLCKS